MFIGGLEEEILVPSRGRFFEEIITAQIFNDCPVFCGTTRSVTCLQDASASMQPTS
jgi:hypothetical protein